MDDVFDLRESALALKADERMIAYAGFTLAADRLSSPCQGVLKVSASYHRDHSGYITLTFLVDIGEGTADRRVMDDLFKGLQEGTLSSSLGSDMEMLVKVPLDFLASLEDWYAEELNIFFRLLKGRERQILEKKLLPALEPALSCTFDKVEWWSGDSVPPLPGDGGARIDGVQALKSFFRRLFAGGRHP